MRRAASPTDRMDTSIFRQTRPRKLSWSERWPYPFVILSSTLTFGVTLLLFPYLEYAPRVLLYGAVLASTRLCGAGPGIAATLLTTAFSSTLVGPGQTDDAHWLEGWTALGGYFAASLLTVAVISQLRNREQILREKDKQLNDFMENATVGLQWMAISGTILWTNRATREILGCTSSGSCRGRKFQEFCADAAEAAELFRRLSAHERVKNHEILLRGDDGVRRLVLIDANALWREDQSIHARCFIRDITARRTAEDALAAERNLLRTLIDALPDAIYTKDSQSRFLISNTANARLLGAADPEDILHRSVSELCPPAIAKRFIEDDQSVLEDGRSIVDREELFVTTDGRERTLLTTKLPLKDSGGAITGLVGISKDITDRKLADAAMRESEERFRVLFEHSPETILILDPSSERQILEIVDCNDVACRHHGYTREELRGQPFGMIDFAARSKARAEAFLQRVRTEGVVTIEALHRHQDGHTFLMEVWASFITVSRRELLLCMARDISERKKAEDAIRRSNELLEAHVRERTRQLEQANRELEAFSYSISHDLRAPVRAIRGFAQIIHEDHGIHLNPEATRLFQFIVDSASRMDELIDDLLAFSRINAHALSRTTIDMRELVDSVIAELHDPKSGAQAEFIIHSLHPAHGDRSLLRQVLVNLIGNALKFSRQSNPPTIEVGSRVENDTVIYHVRDNGVGFNMKYASKLFQVFQRLHNPEQFEGTGVGLAIVQRIIQRHGGRVWVESEPNAGATFYFSLPAVPTEEGAAPRLSPTEPARPDLNLAP
jgi:PAS domain S-box-containing protein